MLQLSEYIQLMQSRDQHRGLVITTSSSCVHQHLVIQTQKCLKEYVSTEHLTGSSFQAWNVDISLALCSFQPHAWVRQ